ncbi:hypothetical protein Acr_27g0006010 [Actinidia rufa]|uniref:Uncharacterized protein n=1 Tax=Actinidia rufa TaxID=165716 RepID=A0A7J0H6Z3_9ERIC|nr:hypothetical protein Acr_27g0006010 [Actinidia rufa]
MQLAGAFHVAGPNRRCSSHHRTRSPPPFTTQVAFAAAILVVSGLERERASTLQLVVARTATHVARSPGAFLFTSLSPPWLARRP